MKTNYVLIDFENVQVKSLALLKGDEFKIFVFVGKNNNKLPFELVNDIQKFGDRGEYVKLESSGPNALDFHIAFYLASWSRMTPPASFMLFRRIAATTLLSIA